MQQQTETTPAVGSNGGTRGRVADAAAQQTPIKLSTIKKSLKELVDLYIVKQDASESYATATKAIAEKAGVMASVVRRLVKAHAGDKFDKAKQEVEQLALVFEDVGDI